MAGKRGRKPKEAEVVEEVNSENDVEEELPKKKRGRPNPKSDDKETKKKVGHSKVESDVEDEEVKDDEEMEVANSESKENDEPETKENEKEEDDEKEETNDDVSDDVEEKPKRGKGKQKKVAKEKPVAQRRGRPQKSAPKYTEESDSNEEQNDKAEDSEEEEEEEEKVVKKPSKKKGKVAKNSKKNGETSPKRSSGRNANKKVASYAEESEDEVLEIKSSKRGRPAGRSKKADDESEESEDEVVEIKSSKRGRPGGRSKKADDESESKKLDKEVRVVLEHCKSCQVYRRNALALKEALERNFDNIDVSINPEKPRRGSFECFFLKEDGSSTILWSGIDKGPPRKLKFPDHEEIISKLQKEL